METKTRCLAGEPSWRSFEAIPDAVLVTRPNGTIAYANEQAERLFHRPRAELAGHPVESVLPTLSREPRAEPRAGDPAEHHVDPMPTRLRSPAVRKDGSEVQVEVTRGFLQDADGPFVVHCIHDTATRGDQILDGGGGPKAHGIATPTRTERTLALSLRFLEIAGRHSELTSLLDEFVEELKKRTGCSAVGIRILDEQGDIPYESSSGFSPEFLASESPLSIKKDRCMCINVIEGAMDANHSYYTPGGSFYMNGTTRFLATVSEEEKGETRNVCNQFGYESVALVPIRSGTRILGLVHLADPREDAVPLDVVEALEKVATQLGMAIQRLLSEEALRSARDDLERTVRERTVQLTEANERLKLEVTERKRAEAEIAEAELRYRTVAEFTYHWEYWQAPDGTFVYVSPSCERVTGHAAEEFIANPGLLRETVHPEDASIWADHYAEACAEHKLRETQFRIRTRDGEIRWIEHACRPVMGHQDEFLGFRVSNRDITDRKRAEEALRKSEQGLAEAQRIAHLGNWDWNIVTNELHWSDEIYRIFGLQPQEFGATYEAFLESVHSDDRERVKEAVERSLGDLQVGYEIDHRIVRPDGSQRVVHESGDVRFDETGRPVRMIGTVHDITELKRAEDDLKTALAEITELKERIEQENVFLREEIRLIGGHEEIVGQSEVMRFALGRIEQVANTDATVLLLGETGTGKELFARAIHDRSMRKDRPLVKVNCAALPSSLIESELFGHVKGAFTGAISDRVGRFRLADGGTIFLDEIGELEPGVQTKLLRVLQEGEFERIGDMETVRVNVRVIAATNRDLQKALREGSFRPDLYYRLAVFPIEAPPLRVHREDIPLLVWHFIVERQARLGKTIKNIPQRVMKALVRYGWPGNVRELENVIERAMILSPGSTLMLPESFGEVRRQGPSDDSPRSLDDVDRAHIVRVLEECNWRVKGAGNAAERLGLKPSTLRYRMKKLGIRRP